MNTRSDTITILTATYNSGATLKRLIASLEAQTDANFEWVVVDGESADDSVRLAEAALIVRKTVISEPDFGIYDALNKGVRVASGEYYLVVGSDDELAPEAVASYRQAVRNAAQAPDLVTAAIRSGSTLCHVRTGKGWLYGLQGYVSAHSIGTLIRTSLHGQFGLYPRKFPIAADHYFIKRAAQGGAGIVVCDFCAGSFGAEGVSSVDLVGTFTEFLRVQLATGESKALQLFLFAVRLLKNYRRL